MAPSDPNIIYAGSGEGLHRPDLSTGDGVYKSTDAGRTWTRLGLNDAQQIPRIDVDPRNPNRLFVAALGHPYGPNEERGIFRSLDGGKTFQKVLHKDENTGGNDVDIDPLHPNVVYATLWEERQGPWENVVWAGTGGGIFKSTDGGTTWKPLTTQYEIPHRLRSYHDTAYDGLFQLQKGWGEIYGPHAFQQQVLDALAELRSQAADINDNESEI